MIASRKGKGGADMNWALEHWSKQEHMALREALQQQAEEGFRLFSEKITKCDTPMLGVRTPILRQIAKEIGKGDSTSFLKTALPYYHEEYILLGLVIGESPMEYDAFQMEVDEFVKKIKSWAVCDIFCSSVKKQIAKQKEAFFQHITLYLRSKNPWTIRVGLIMMLSHYLEEGYIKKVLQRCDKVKDEFYYVKMAQAWLVAAAWVKFPQETKEYLQKCTLDDWTFQKSIQKACESKRVTDEDKSYLRTLKRKGRTV